MSNISKTHKEYLKEKFKDRVTFDDVERMLYGHDIAAMPSLIKPLIGDTTPDAVVQPQSEEELKELVMWAAKNHIPLTPRGKASSGYGGVLPVENGIVVDFYRIKKVLSIDKDKLTATVQPGIVWEGLDRELKKKGLTLPRFFLPATRAQQQEAGLPREVQASVRLKPAGSGTSCSVPASCFPMARSVCSRGKISI